MANAAEPFEHGVPPDFNTPMQETAKGPSPEFYGATTSVARGTPFEKRKIAEVRQCLLVADAQCAAAMQRIAALEASTSWRATAPLRVLVNGCRQRGT